MGLDAFLLLRFEWMIALIIFILLIAKLSDADKNVKTFRIFINILLAINFLVGFLPVRFF